MNVLIVHAHNEPQSFNTAMLNLAVEVLSGQGHEVVVSDLYAMNFNPVASAGDFGQRANSEHLVYALEQRNGYTTGTLAPDILADHFQLPDLLVQHAGDHEGLVRPSVHLRVLLWRCTHL